MVLAKDSMLCKVMRLCGRLGTEYGRWLPADTLLDHFKEATIGVSQSAMRGKNPTGRRDLYPKNDWVEGCAKTSFVEFSWYASQSALS
jgi:hypothetical protein